MKRSRYPSPIFVSSFLLAWILLNALGSFWLTEKTNHRYSYLWRHQQNLAALPHPPQILFFGNSSAYCAFQPPLLNSALESASTYNHAVPIGGLAVPHVSLTRFLSNYPCPRIIFWAISPYELKSSHLMPLINVGKELTFQDLTWIWQTGGSRALFLKPLVVNSFAPIYRDRILWQEILRGSKRVGPIRIGPLGAVKLSLIEKSSDPDPVTWERTRRFYRRTMTQDFLRGKTGKDLIVSFKNRCDALNIRLILMSLPVSSNYSKLYYEGDYDWALNELQEICQQEKITYWNMEDWLDDTAFHDGVHLNQEAVILFNQKFIPLIRDVVQP